MIVVEWVECLNHLVLELGEETLDINQKIEVLEIECVKLTEMTSIPNNVSSKEYT